jgi:nucleoside 2-deoxyribosyltransferase
MNKLRIYLAGPMFECDGDEMHVWREKLMSDYGHTVDFIDPTTHIMQNEDDSKAIVEMDKKAILSADAVLAHPWKASPGTSMEILFAWMNNIPVHVVLKGKMSGWINYHATGVYDSFMDAMENIFDDVGSCTGGCGRVVDTAGNQVHNAECPVSLLTEEERAFGRIATILSEPIDMVNHPSHYTMGGIETKDFIRAKELSYNLGNAVKYITRSGHKPGVCPIEDLKKAVFYLNDEIGAREAEAQTEAERQRIQLAIQNT